MICEAKHKCEVPDQGWDRSHRQLNFWEPEAAVKRLHYITTTLDGLATVTMVTRGASIEHQICQ
jgi:hypothetical protein